MPGLDEPLLTYNCSQRIHHQSPRHSLPAVMHPLLRPTITPTQTTQSSPITSKRRPTRLHPAPLLLHKHHLHRGRSPRTQSSTLQIPSVPVAQSRILPAVSAMHMSWRKSSIPNLKSDGDGSEKWSLNLFSDEAGYHEHKSSNERSESTRWRVRSGRRQ